MATSKSHAVTGLMGLIGIVVTLVLIAIGVYFASEHCKRVSQKWREAQTTKEGRPEVSQALLREAYAVSLLAARARTTSIVDSTPTSAPELSVTNRRWTPSPLM